MVARTVCYHFHRRSFLDLDVAMVHDLLAASGVFQVWIRRPLRDQS